MNDVAILKNKKILHYDAVMLGATTCGFFYDAGTRLKNCRHEKCGYRPPPYRDCFSYDWNNHAKKGCQPNWCVVEHGKVPNVLPKEKLAKCKRTYFSAYSNKELADPATKVELVAVALDVGTYGDYPCNAVAVYDLLNDKWHNDKWWTITPNGHLAPHAYRHPKVAPQEIVGIDAVIAKLKAAL